MIIEQTKLDGVLLIKPTIYEDERGYFFESYSDDNFKSIGLSGKFSQDNQTKSKKGTLRGLHYQLNYIVQRLALQKLLLHVLIQFL